jgi:4-hydroxy-3-polyprenylbenzoate decarboxylase
VKDLREFINLLDDNQELARIKYPVSADLEITEIADRICISVPENKFRY